MADDLRAQIAQQLRITEGRLNPADNYHEVAAADILPLMEQAIQQAVERAAEEHNAACCPEDVGCEEYILSLERRLAEKDAQIAALREKVAELSSALVAEVTARSNAELRYALERFEDAAGVRRETPAPRRSRNSDLTDDLLLQAFNAGDLANAEAIEAGWQSNRRVTDAMRAVLAPWWRAALADRDAETFGHLGGHWFTQGGQAQFGELGRTENADELISEILRATRSKVAEQAQQIADLGGALSELTDDYCAALGDGLTESNQPRVLARARKALASRPTQESQ